MMPSRGGVVVLVAAPPVLLASIAVVLSVLGWFGRNPFWQHDGLTLSEATALRDHATVLLLLENGVDPGLRYKLRAGVLSERESELTPMEAAIHEDRPEMVDLLLRHGVTVDGPRLCTWLDLATSLGKKDVSLYLRNNYPDTQSCDPRKTGLR